MPGLSTQVNIMRIFESVVSTYISWPDKIPRFKRKCSYIGEAYAGYSSALLFIDYQNAFNSINRKKLFDEFKRRNILEENEANFLLWLYSNQIIQCEDSTIQTLFGVPQGGINSPILFNFCMYFMMEELIPECETIATRHLNRTPITMKTIVPCVDNTFVFADDLAFHLYGPTESNALQLYFKEFIPILSNHSENWGLRINFKKSGLLPLFKSKKEWTRHCFNDVICGIPIVNEYKYLGVIISSNLSMQSQVNLIKKKITYLAKCFYCFKNKTDDLRFAYNTWQIFIRPLLDYTFVAAAYCIDSKDQIAKLYRSSIKIMLGLKDNAENYLVDSIIQYNYNSMRAIAIKVYQEKWQAYKNGKEEEQVMLYGKVRFPYQKLEMRAIPVKMINSYNILTTNNYCNKCSDSEKKIRLSIRHMKNVHNVDIQSKINNTFKEAHEIYIELKAIKQRSSFNNKDSCEYYQLNKKLIVNKIVNIKTSWLDIYNNIVCLIWDQSQL